eukprot:GHUV01035391.1.p1 GENE.GHUV01035391.1~~GHUV01035391.1.p1  ORF type:complete len:167 (-),score=7.25 GHUV01035391.1:325-825(-)
MSTFTTDVGLLHNQLPELSLRDWAAACTEQVVRGHIAAAFGALQERINSGVKLLYTQLNTPGRPYFDRGWGNKLTWSCCCAGSSCCHRLEVCSLWGVCWVNMRSLTPDSHRNNRIDLPVGRLHVFQPVLCSRGSPLLTLQVQIRSSHYLLLLTTCLKLFNVESWLC